MTSRIRAAAAALSLTVALSGSLAVAASPAQAAAKKGCYITATAAKIRSKATTSSTAVGVAYKNNTCKELDFAFPKGNYYWVKVKMTSGNAKNKTGWVRDDLIHITEDDIGTCIPEDPDC